MILQALALATPGLPLAMALAMVAPQLRGPVGALLPAAALPGLLLVLVSPEGFAVALPSILLGAELGLDAPRRIFLGFTAGLWLAAAAYSRGYISHDLHRHRYNAFFLVTMGGNLGLIVALDVVSFYVTFSLMTLTSYILVVFERTEKAYRAGRIYLVLSLLGEAALLLGCIAAAARADSIIITDIAARLGEGSGQEATLALLVLGFVIKAGVFPLHVWLPLAHPAAPTPASAVLSGAMIKAGLLGLVVFLPLGEAALPSLGATLTVLGLGTAFYGVLCGVPQANPKTVLAYSSLSQMGLLVAAFGLGLQEPEAAPALVPALSLYALHHGLAKGSLFLSVGVVERTQRGSLLALAVALLCALAIAGAPLTAGALAKLSLKHGGEAAETSLAQIMAGLLSWSACATALLLARFLYLLRAEAAEGKVQGKAGPWLWGPFLLLALASQLAPWLLTTAEHREIAAEALSGYGLWESFWPVALAALVAAGSLLIGRGRHLPSFPEGDWIVVLPRSQAVSRFWDLLYLPFAERREGRAGLFDSLLPRLAAPVEATEKALSSRGVVLLTLAAVALILGVGLD